MPRTSALISIGIKSVAVAVVLFLAFVYLKLGIFALALFPLGAWAAVRLTRKERAHFTKSGSVILTVLIYFVAMAAVQRSVIRHRTESWDLTWKVVQERGASEPEVHFGLGNDHYLISHSAELINFLQSRTGGRVRASLPITRTLGCFQGVGPVEIEGWGTAPSGGYLVVGSGPGPWPDHWWCP